MKKSKVEKFLQLKQKREGQQGAKESPILLL